MAANMSFTLNDLPVFREFLTKEYKQIAPRIEPFERLLGIDQNKLNALAAPPTGSAEQQAKDTELLNCLNRIAADREFTETFNLLVQFMMKAQEELANGDSKTQAPPKAMPQETPPPAKASTPVVEATGVQLLKEQERQALSTMLNRHAEERQKQKTEHTEGFKKTLAEVGIKDTNEQTKIANNLTAIVHSTSDEDVAKFASKYTLDKDDKQLREHFNTKITPRMQESTSNPNYKFDVKVYHSFMEKLLHKHELGLKHNQDIQQSLSKIHRSNPDDENAAKAAAKTFIQQHRIAEEKPAIGKPRFPNPERKDWKQADSPPPSSKTTPGADGIARAKGGLEPTHATHPETSTPTASSNKAVDSPAHTSANRRNMT